MVDEDNEEIQKWVTLYKENGRKYYVEDTYMSFTWRQQPTYRAEYLTPYGQLSEEPPREISYLHFRIASTGTKLLANVGLVVL